MSNKAIESAIGEWLFRYYGLRGRLDRLGGENLNYLVSGQAGEKFVFKAVDEALAEESAAMEFELLEHARRAGFSRELPFIIKNYKGNIDSGIEIPLIGEYRARILSLVNGITLENLRDISIEMLVDTGKCLAEFNRAVAGFDHPALHRGHQWELPRAGQHRDKLDSVADPEMRSLAAWAFDLWDEIKDGLNDLPQQVIHGDANPENILAAEGRIIGLVDFGDTCHNPRICELAICISYVMMGRDDPLEAAAAVLAGYAESCELLEDELAVLFPLACTRLAVSICMASARLEIDADNPNWFTSLEPAGRLLRRLYEIGAERIGTASRSGY